MDALPTPPPSGGAGRRRVRRPRSQYVEAIAVVSVGIALSLIGHFFSAADRTEALRSELRWRAESRAAAIRETIVQQIDAVTSIGDFHRASEAVTDEEFQVFAGAILERYVEFAALAWVEESAGSTIVERLVRSRQGPASIDLPAIEAAAAAIDAAQRAGSARISAPFRLGEVDGAAAFCVAVPEAGDGTPDRGIGVGVVLVERMFDRLLSAMPPGYLATRLTDPEDSPAAFYVKRSRLGGGAGSGRTAPALTWETEIELPGRTWAVSFEPEAEFRVPGFAGLPWISLFGGLAITALAGVALFNRARYAAHRDRLLDRLVAANEELRSGIDDRRRAEDRLERVLTQTIEAFGRTTEARDPYTANHQRRVTDLAGAIAAELGLDEASTRALRFAGYVHDVGKLVVPAEILAKPSALTAAESALLKEHPAVGASLLREIDFPWPIAEIIHQHHERIDGSGYPRGLEGDEILREAKILAVADVVEAIASHRPYRAALGVGAALEEIREGRGRVYDPDVADACIRLFTERGYRFPPTGSATRS